MRRSDLVLLAVLQLCRARQHGFSIHDDLLAYPQVRTACAWTNGGNELQGTEMLTLNFTGAV
jgi:hypothetical protein